MNSKYAYDIHLPSNYDLDQKYPVLFTLHGKGSNEQNMYGLVEALREQFIIIGIRGNLNVGYGFQYYELKSLGNPIREQFDEAIAGLKEFIQYATEKYPVDEHRRYLLGFSQGAILSLSLALSMGNQLKGVVALNGYIPGFVKTEYALKSVADTAFFISHGEYDQVFPLSIAHETTTYLEGLSERVTFKTYPSDHSVSRDNQQDLLQWIAADTDNNMAT